MCICPCTVNSRRFLSAFKLQGYLKFDPENSKCWHTYSSWEILSASWICYFLQLLACENSPCIAMAPNRCEISLSLFRLWDMTPYTVFITIWWRQPRGSNNLNQPIRVAYCQSNISSIEPASPYSSCSIKQLSNKSPITQACSRSSVQG